MSHRTDGKTREVSPTDVSVNWRYFSLDLEKNVISLLFKHDIPYIVIIDDFMNK